MKKPKWLAEINEQKPTRHASKKQESRIAKELKGKTTANSGATWGENDVVTDYCEVEAKTTGKESFPLKKSDWEKLQRKCSATKIPLMQVDMNGAQLAVLQWDDLLYLLNKSNE